MVSKNSFYSSFNNWFSLNKNHLTNQEKDFAEEIFFNRKKEITIDLLKAYAKLSNKSLENLIEDIKK